MTKDILDLIVWVFLFTFALFLWIGIGTFASSKSAFHDIFATMWILGSVLSLGFSAVVAALVNIFEQNEKK